MKSVFWVLTFLVVGLLALTISETHKLRQAQRELDRSVELNIRVQTVLLNKQKQAVATALAGQK